jgi:hypothetical protein
MVEVCDLENELREERIKRGRMAEQIEVKGMDPQALALMVEICFAGQKVEPNDSAR